jgi:hypothetical protein
LVDEKENQSTAADAMPFTLRSASIAELIAKVRDEDAFEVARRAQRHADQRHGMQAGISPRPTQIRKDEAEVDHDDGRWSKFGGTNILISRMSKEQQYMRARTGNSEPN